MKRFLSVILTVLMLAVMMTGITVNAEEKSWTDGFKVIGGSGATIEKDRIILEPKPGDTTNLIVEKRMPIPRNYEIKFTMAMEVWSKLQDVIIYDGRYRYYMDISTTRLNYMPTNGVAKDGWKGFDFPFGNEAHEFHIKSIDGVAETYVDGYYLGTADLQIDPADTRIQFLIGGQKGQNKMVITNLEVKSLAVEKKVEDKPPVEDFYTDFSDPSENDDWLRDDYNEWHIKDGVFMSDFETESYTRVSARAHHALGFADDFDFHTRLRYTSHNWQNCIYFKLGHKWLSFWKMDVVWYYQGESSGSVRYDYDANPTGKWIDIDIKTYNRCEAAKIYVDGVEIFDVKFGNYDQLTTIPTTGFGVMNNAYRTDFAHSQIEIDEISIKQRNTNIKINNIYGGDSFLEGDDLDIKSTFSGKKAPEKIDYYIDDMLYGTGVAPDYKLVLKDLPAGTHVIQAKSGEETSIKTTFNIVQAIEGEIKIDKIGGSYSVYSDFYDEVNQIKEIEYLIDGKSVGSSKEKPYKVSVPDLYNGKHTIVAICKGATGVSLATFTRTYDAIKTGTNHSEHFSHDISYTVSGKGGAAVYDMANGMHRLYLKHTADGVTYLSKDGEQTYKFGTGRFEVLTNGEYADVYRNGQLAFSLIMPKTTDIYKKVSGDGIKITNENVAYPEFRNTYFIDKNLGAGEHIYNIPNMPYIHNLVFTAKKTDNARFVINDGVYRTDLTMKDGKFTVWDAGVMTGATVTELREMCDVPDIDGEIVFRLETVLGMSRLYADGDWIGSFRSTRSAGGKSLAINVEEGTTLRHLSLIDSTDLFTFSDTFEDEGEFESKDYWHESVEYVSEDGKVLLEAEEGKETFGELTVYAGNAVFEADVNVSKLSGGFWMVFDHAVDGAYSKIGYNVKTGKLEYVTREDTTQQKVASTIKSTTASLPLNETLRFKIVLEQQNPGEKLVSFFVNGAEILKGVKSNFTRGRLGFLIEGGKATIDNLSYKGDARVLRGATNRWVLDMVQGSCEAYEVGSELHLVSQGIGRAVSKDGGYTFEKRPFVTGSTWNIYQFQDEEGKTTGELLSIWTRTEESSPEGHIRRNYELWRSFDFGETWTCEGRIYDADSPDAENYNCPNLVGLNWSQSSLVRGQSGRMYFPCQYGLNENEGSIYIMYSDDRGKTWTESETVFRYDDPEFKEKGLLFQEPQVMELSDGTVRLIARNNSGYIIYFDSHDGGKTFDKTVNDTPFLANQTHFNIEEDQFNPGTVYACWSYDNKNSGQDISMPRTRYGLARSTDDWKTWEYLGTYFEFIPNGGNHSNSNLTVSITQNYLILGCDTLKYWKTNTGTWDNLAVVVEKDKLQPTKAFEQVHVTRNDPIGYRHQQFENDAMIIVSTENGNVVKSGELFSNSAIGRYVSAEILAQYASMKSVYNADGSVTFKAGETEYVFDKSQVKDDSGIKYISIDAFAEKFNKFLYEEDGVIILDSIDEKVDAKKELSGYSVDTFKQLTQKLSEETSEATVEDQ